MITRRQTTAAKPSVKVEGKKKKSDNTKPRFIQKYVKVFNPITSEGFPVPFPWIVGKDSIIFPFDTSDLREMMKAANFSDKRLTSKFRTLKCMTIESAIEYGELIDCNLEISHKFLILSIYRILRSM